MNKSSLIYDNMNYTLSNCGTAFFFGFLEQIGWLFYIVPPSKSAKESHDEVTNYEVAIFPIIAFLIGLEQFYKFVTQKKNNKLNDIIINQGAGLLFLMMR